jgi:S1-C subfamily serine protease
VPGEAVELSVFRDGEKITVSVILGETPGEVHAAQLDQMLRQQAGLFVIDREDGVYVNLAVPDGPAYRAGVRSRDRLVAVDDEAVRDSDGLVALFEKRRFFAGKAVAIDVERTNDDGEAVKVKISFSLTDE